MSTMHWKNPQKAQGMVEFALVLPILLLVILGIFAFGHLFFVYSSVVSASREAARWGAAVGEAPSAAPRYQDCTSIRAAAVRVGTFAGVSPNTVTVNYDHGPVNPPNAPVVFANCPLAGTGPDSTMVRRGDRIVVRVTVQYTPIVPFVNLPSFPLTAETGRTIVKSLPVGDAPVAEDPCITPTTLTITDSPLQSVVGQQVTFGVTVTAQDGTTPTGTVTYSDTDGNSLGPTTLVNGQASFSVAFQTAGDKDISVRYEPDNECQMGSAVTDHWYTVNKANTTLNIIDPNDPSGRGHTLYVTVQLAVTSPGAATALGPQGGQVNISLSSGGTNNSCVATIDALLTATCSVIPSQQGLITISATYAGDSNYNGSSDTEPHTVIPPETATFLPSPTTFVPTATGPVATPTIPPYCPSASGIDFSRTGALEFVVNNTNPSNVAGDLTSIDVTWPSLPTAKLQSIRFGDASGLGSCSTTGQQSNRNCVWRSSTGIDPTHQYISSAGPTQWVGYGINLAQNSSKSMRLVFDHALPQGHYRIVLRIGNCPVIVEGDKLTP